MFDTNKVASNIKNARTKMNMTQMNLADEMGVSYQAVSNWERGNSMPDISKLPELCKILNISFEELVGERTAETDIAEKLMQDEDADVALEDMAQVGQLVKPDKIERKVNEEIGKGGKIPFSTLVSLAPFIERETMDKIVDKCIQNEHIDVNNIVAIAPFLSKSIIQKIAGYLIEHGQAKKLVLIAPFMGKDMFSNLLKGIQFDMSGKGENNSCSTNAELDDLDEDDVAKLAFEVLEQGSDVEEYLDYMNEDDVAKLALRALELGKETERFLDYMNEDDVEKLAFKALEAGKPIDCYLDYMDEDAIKKMLLKSVNK